MRATTGQNQKRSQSSISRDKRKVKGYRRIEAMISPTAAAALEKLTHSGIPKARAISTALIEAAKKTK